MIDYDLIISHIKMCAYMGGGGGGGWGQLIVNHV